MSIFQVIRFDGLASRDWLIYKFPTNKIVLGSQLIVQEGQTALFVKNGQVADVFTAGRYTLSTKNLPLLSKIVNLPFGGDTPFSAEVYFVNTTFNLGIKWGTTDPIQLIDPKYQIKLNVRAFGQMGLRVSDVEAVFKHLIGAIPQGDLVKYAKIKDHYLGILSVKVKSLIADAIINSKISALEISTKLEELSEQVRVSLADNFLKYGFNVVNFYIESINFPNEDFEKINQILSDNAAFNILGESRYRAKRSFDVYEGAANNENGVAGAFAASGVGLGAGIGIATQMNNLTQEPLKQTETKACVECKSQIPANSKFCAECGANNQPKVCECGTVLTSSSKFCSNCGKKQ